MNLFLIKKQDENSVNENTNKITNVIDIEYYNDISIYNKNLLPTSKYCVGFIETKRTTDHEWIIGWYEK